MDNDTLIQAVKDVPEMMEVVNRLLSQEKELETLKAGGSVAELGNRLQELEEKANHLHGLCDAKGCETCQAQRIQVGNLLATEIPKLEEKALFKEISQAAIANGHEAEANRIHADLMKARGMLVEDHSPSTLIVQNPAA